MKKSIAAALILLGCSAAYAQDRGAVREACKADMDRLCADASAGGGRRDCMRSHRDELSQGCKDAIATMRQQRQQN